jgi:hypothetical protein
VAGGQEITSGSGSATPSEDVPLTGSALTSATGTLFADLGTTEEALTGDSATAEAGTAVASRLVLLRSRKVGGGAASRALTGQSASSSTGSLIHVPSTLLAGSQVGLSLGAFGKSRTKDVSGSSVSVSTGSVTGPGTSQVQLTTLTLSAAGAFTVGQAFVKGDVASGQTITAGLTQFQADVRSRWADGSVRFAVLSGISTGSTALYRGGTPYSGSNVAEPSTTAVVDFTSVVNSSGAVVSGGTLQASLATARANGSMSWTRTTAHKVRQILGPVMSEFHYFCPTADAHTHVWFYVRAYVNGSVEVETVVENGWLQVASPDRRNYNVAVTIAGTSRYTGSLVHYHHTRWSRVDWAGTDPAVVPKHDVAYLQRTSVVPTLAVSALASAAYSTRPENGTKHNAWTQTLAERPTPFSLANIDPALGSGGDTDMYGIVPGWGATYLAEGNAGAFWSCVANGRALGHFPIHYRDETDGRPFRGSANPTLGINASNSGLSETGGFATSTPTPSGGVPSPEWYYSHAPAAYFTAALLTGRWQFIEGSQFQVGTAEMQNGFVWSTYRVNGWWEQMRYIGWKMRDRVQAELLTPSEYGGSAVSGADANQRTEAVGRVTASVDMTYDYYVSGTSTSNPSRVRGNALGVPYNNFDNDFGGANNDGEYGYGGLLVAFYVLGFLYAFDAEPSVSSGTTTKLQGLAEHFGKLPSGLLGAQPNGSNWDWRVMSFVTMSFGTPGSLSSGGDANETTQTIRSSWNAQWTRYTSNVAPLNWSGTPPQSLPSDNYLRWLLDASGPSYTISTLTTFPTLTDVVSMIWAANYMHKVADRASISGADTAIGRLIGSDTWAHGLANAMLTRPEFAVKTDRYLPNWVPATVGASTKLATTNALDAVDLEGVWSGDSAAHFGDYSGGAYNRYWGTFGAHVLHGGGHSANNDNSVFLFDYNDLTFKRIAGPTQLASAQAYQDIVSSGPDNMTNPREYASGVPGSAHTYGMMAILPPSICGDSKGALIRPVASAISTSASKSTGWSHLCTMTTPTWSRWSTGSFPTAEQGWDGGGCVYDTTRQRIWPIRSSGAPANYLDLSTRAWVAGSAAPAMSNSYADTVLCCYDSNNDIGIISTCQNGGGAGQSFYYFSAAGSGTERTAVTFSSGSLPDARFGGGNIIYIPELNKVIYWTYQNRDVYYEITVNVGGQWSWIARSITGPGRPSLITGNLRAETFGRLDYAPQLKSLVFVVCRDLNDFVWGNNVLCIRIVPGSASAPSTPLYSTTFATAETPISEGGNWLKLTPEGGASDHSGWHGMITSGGSARPRYNAGPTMGGPGSGDYDDCYAYLAGTWPTNLRAEATVYRGAGNKEMELLFRVSDQASPARIWAYECLFDYGVGSVEIARWDGLPDGYVTLNAGTPGTYADGDRIAAEITGTNPVVITCYVSRAATPTTWEEILTYSDSSASRLTTGAPGIGAFCRTNASNSSLDYGIKDYSVEEI